MTLILSLAAPHFVVQVSDRLVTYLATGLPKDAATTKMVLFCNSMAFGYMGLAELEGVTTDIWLWKVLAEGSDRDLGLALKRVAERAADAIEQTCRASVRRADCRLAFVGVGFTRTASGEPLRPVLCRVSNFHGRDGRASPEPSDQFSVGFAVYGGPQSPPWGWLETGAPLRHSEQAWLSRALRRFSMRAIGPGAVARLFHYTILDVSRRDRTVGRNLLAAIIPRSAADLSYVALAGPDNRSAFVLQTGPSTTAPPIFDPGNSMHFMSIPGDGNLATQQGPHIACPGMGFAMSSPTIEYGRK